jgi:CTP:phosphocholine cytidylyltransferase-like protein
MDALILAAGLGSRMEDLTNDIPKPLLKINNKTLISYALEIATKLPLSNIYVNTHYQADKLNQYLIEEYPHIIISHENLILGTGGGIKKAQKQDLLVMNTDNLWQLSFISEIEKAIAHFSQNQNIENLLLVNSDSSNNDLEINGKNIIFPSQKKNTKFQGCHLLRNESLNAYPDIFDIPLYWKDCSMKQRLFGFETSTKNPHIGTKELYLQY